MKPRICPTCGALVPNSSAPHACVTVNDRLYCNAECAHVYAPLQEEEDATVLEGVAA